MPRNQEKPPVRPQAGHGQRRIIMFAFRRPMVLSLSTAAAGLVTLGAVWAANEAARDMTKEAVEVPQKAVIAAAARVEADNPKVAPGKVNWHPTFAEACEASKKSG